MDIDHFFCKNHRLDIFLFTANWSEPCTDFIPRCSWLLCNCHTFLDYSNLLSSNGNTATIVNEKNLVGQQKNLKKLCQVFIIDVDKEPDLCQYYRIMGLPTIVFKIKVIDRGKSFEVPGTRIIGTCKIEYVENVLRKLLVFYAENFQNESPTRKADS